MLLPLSMAARRFKQCLNTQRQLAGSMGTALICSCYEL